MTEVKNLTLIEVIIPQIENKTLVIIKDIVLVLSFAILTGVCAKLKIEVGAVPITMQTFAILLAGALLGSKRGAASQLTYLFGGLAGIPWFASGGGMAYILRPTFGYMVGFVFSAYLVGWLCERGWDRNLKTAILAMLLGNIVLYIPGLLWLAEFTGFGFTGYGFGRVLALGLYPFIIGDLLKIFLAGLILSSVWKIIKQ